MEWRHLCVGDHRHRHRLALRDASAPERPVTDFKDSNEVAINSRLHSYIAHYDESLWVSRKLYNGAIRTRDNEKRADARTQGRKATVR